MTTELCKKCGKPKEEHYYLELFNEWCCTPPEDIYNSDRFTPKKSNDSHSSQSGSKTNDKTSSENHSSFKTLKDIFGNVDCECGAVKTYEHYLKAEAIKWVKKYTKENEVEKRTVLIKFFNLTEEDLK